MKIKITYLLLSLLFILSPVSVGAEPLPSWNPGRAKKAILDFVEKTTTPGSPDFIPEPERIAVFDNDGTLWCEQPVYPQVQFAFDQIKALAPKHPEWKTKEPYASVLKGDIKGAIESGEKEFLGMMLEAYANNTTEEYSVLSAQWLRTSRQPRFDKPYTQLVYQPMLEVLGLLRSKGFKTYIVSGGGIEFMRVFSDQIYGIPPGQVIGSSVVSRYELRNGKPVILRLPELEFICDYQGKAVAIEKVIGTRPAIAFGNSDGDYEMLQWTTSAPGLRLGVIIHHDDAKREYAYDRDSAVGHLDKALTEALKAGWIVTSMKNDWKTVFPSK